MKLFSLEGKSAVVLGGAGVLGEAMSRGLAEAGARVCVADYAEDRAQAVAELIRTQGGRADGRKVDATSKASLEMVCSEMVREYGAIDILVSAVGGNRPDATVSDQCAFFDIPEEALQKVMHLNLFAGAILPAQVFGKAMGTNERGSIINVSSMNAVRPLTRIAGYSAAKAAVSNFTQWLAVYLNQCGHTNLRVNAIAPGFFLTEQNRFLLTDKDTGELTQRGNQIISHTPMGRFGQPDDLVGTVVWLASDASVFVNGTVVPIDGGFSAYSGV